MRRTIATLVVASGLAVAGCAGQPAKPPPTSPAKTGGTAARQVLGFGEERAGKRGVVTVGKPVAHELPADPARPTDLTRGLRFDVVVKNTSKQALPASEFAFAPTVNGAPASLVTDPARNIGNKLTADVLPGGDRKLGLVLAVPAKPAEVTVKVTFAGTNPMYWTGTE